MRKGIFIVIEGIDGAGGETQSKILKERFEKLGKKVLLLRYPDRSKDIGKFIYEHLEKQEIFTPEALTLLFLADFLKDKEKILSALEEGKIVVADRYFTSTLVYQTAQGIEVEKLLKLAELFELPKPDIAILLKISSETSVKRKKIEKNELDRFEKNPEFLDKVEKLYEKFAKENIFCHWKIVNGEKSIEDVAKEIWKIIRKFLEKQS